jgi:glucose/arabinose dehydrogenase
MISTSNAENTCSDYPLVQNYKHYKSNKCLGSVLTDSDVPWEKPRRVLLNQDETLIYVTDMGGWDNRDSGVLWEVNLLTKKYRQIYRGGDWTHGLQQDSARRLLVGNTNKIIRQKSDGSWLTVISDLPSGGSHPLSHFILLENDDLILNVGAPSNDCSKEFSGTHCAQRDVEGEVRHYSYRTESDSYDPNYRVLARGLRNSMALVFNENTNSLYQAENSLDQFGIPEEFNVIPMDSTGVYDFGWPFCFGMNQEYRFPNQSGIRPGAFRSFCSRVAIEPLFLIPAHSAPLDMIYYTGDEHNKELSDSILMGWHGHRRSEEYALVSYSTDSQLSPLFTNDGLNSFEPLISGVGLNEKDKLRPVGLTQDRQGRIWIVDDIQRRVFIYANGQVDDDLVIDVDSSDAQVQEYISQISPVLLNEFERLYNEFYSVQTCTQCHGPNEIPSVAEEALEVFLKRGWLEMDNQSPINMPLMKRTSVNANKAMPPPPERPFEESNPVLYQNLLNWLIQVNQ